MTLSRRNHPSASTRHSQTFDERIGSSKSLHRAGDEYATRDDGNWPIIRAHLIEERKILADLVDELHASGVVYADSQRPHPNLVFLHRDKQGVVQGGSLFNSKPEFPSLLCLGHKNTAWFFVGDLSNASTIAAVDTPINALSYYCLERSRDLAVVSCAGATVPNELMFQVYDRKQSLVVALNNNPAGERGWQKAWDETADWQGFKISSNCPVLKDWNADLVQSLELRRSSSIKV